MIHFDIPKIEEELASLEQETLKNNFWEDTQKANNILTKIKEKKGKVLAYRKLEK